MHFKDGFSFLIYLDIRFGDVDFFRFFFGSVILKWHETYPPEVNNCQQLS